MKKVLIIIGLAISSAVAHGQALGYMPPPLLLYDSSGNPFPNGSGTPLGYNPPPFSCYTVVDGSAVPCTFSGGGGSGTVTSVGLTANADFSVTGSPVTTAGILAFDWATPPTGTGAMVRNTSPTFITPLLGTPTSGVITNLTGACASCTANSATTATTATTATNIAGGANGSVPYNTGSGATTFLAGNTSATPNFYTSTGTGAAANAPTLTSSVGTGSVFLASGVTGTGTTVVMSAGPTLTGTATIPAVSFTAGYNITTGSSQMVLTSPSGVLRVGNGSSSISVPFTATSTSITAGTTLSAGTTVSGTKFLTSTACASSASPAVCSAAAGGFVVVAAAATTVVVNTTAVTANSQILVQEDSSLGTALSVTCNTTPATAPPTISARTAATSFTITTTTPAVNPRCFSYGIVN